MTMMMVPTKETILVIMANESTQTAIEKTLRQGGYEVVLAPDEASALAAIQEVAPSLIVIDWQAGYIERIRLHRSVKNVPIIVFGSESVCSEEECLEDLERGADLVVCNETPRQLAARVRAILRRKQAEQVSSIHRHIGIQMDLDRHEVRVKGVLVELTPKEFQILRHFMESPGRVFSRQEMLNCVWGEGYALEEHALDVHIHSLRQKIEDDPAKPKLIVTVRGVGYKFRVPS